MQKKKLLKHQPMRLNILVPSSLLYLHNFLLYDGSDKVCLPQPKLYFSTQEHGFAFSEQIKSKGSTNKTINYEM